MKTTRVFEMSPDARMDAAPLPAGPQAIATPAPALPPVRTMYAALVGKDVSFEGVFFAAITTTGIFCRPTCSARKPKPANVRYFATSAEALSEGFRPCARCRPLEPPAAPKLVRRLASGDFHGRMSDAALASEGIDPSTARRQFRKYFGLTFQEYDRRRRLGEAVGEIKGGESVIGAQIGLGYESASGFWSAFRSLFGERPTRAGSVRLLTAGRIATPLGPMLAVADDEGLRMLEFADRRALPREIAMLRKREGAVIVPGSHPHLAVIERELTDYFALRLDTFTVPLAPAGSPFDMSVWAALRTIEPGSTWSYQNLAAAIGRPEASRAVAQANGRNSLAIVIPCHRVIRADGSISGYGGGVWRKRRLLDLEAGLLTL